MKRLFTMVYLVLLFAAFTFADVINVPGDQASIQDGINAAVDGDTVLVAEGTYLENINFMGKAITVASHYIMDEDTSHISNTIIDGSSPSNADSGSVVFFISGEDTTSLIYGFTITGGSGTKWNDGGRTGGGIFMLEAGGKVLFNRIINNHLFSETGVISGGAGMEVIGDAESYSIISGNEISNNVVTGYQAYAGGAALGTGGTIRFEGNTVKNNLLQTSYNNAGGGLLLWGGEYEGQTYNGRLIVSANLISGNECETGSFTGNSDGGGGVFFENSSAEFTNNIITDNTAELGGGLSVFTLNNTVSRPLLMNNTITDNAADKGGGMYVTRSYPKVINTILWGNTAAVEDSEIYDPADGTVIYNSVVQDVEWSEIDITCFNADPDFADALYNLSAESPCVGMGRQIITLDEVTYEAPTVDFYSNPRSNEADAYIDVGAVESAFSANAYPLNLVLSGRYVEVSGGSLQLTTEVLNPHSEDITVYGRALTMEGIVTDSVQLFDDGAHNDGDAADGVFGGSLENIDEEAFFRPGIGILDNGSEHYTVFNDNKIFTTIGPIKVDHYVITSSDTVPNHGERLDYKLTIINNGQTATATNVTTNLKSLDSCATISGFPDRPYGDIAPGATALHRGSHSIIFSENCPDSIYAQILVEISSDGQVFWSDTFSVIIHKDPTGMTKNNENIPSEFALKQNYPNPFNPTTQISFALPKPENVIIEVYNTLGQRVEVLLKKRLQAGNHEVEFNAVNMSSGVYLYKIQAGEFQDVKKMILLR